MTMTIQAVVRAMLLIAHIHKVPDNKVIDPNSIDCEMISLVVVDQRDCREIGDRRRYVAKYEYWHKRMISSRE